MESKSCGLDGRDWFGTENKWKNRRKCKKCRKRKKNHKVNEKYSKYVKYGESVGCSECLLVLNVNVYKMLVRA